MMDPDPIRISNDLWSFRWNAGVVIEYLENILGKVRRGRLPASLRESTAALLRRWIEVTDRAWQAGEDEGQERGILAMEPELYGAFREWMEDAMTATAKAMIAGVRWSDC